MRICEPDSFARKDTEDPTSPALIGSPRTPRAADMAAEASALVFQHPARASTPGDRHPGEGAAPTLNGWLFQCREVEVG